MGNSETRARIGTIALWALLLGVGIWATYVGMLSFSRSRAVLVDKIASGEVRTELSGAGLAFVQSLRSAILYAAVAWICLVLVALFRRQTPQQVLARGWVWVLAIGVAIKLLGELLLNPGLFLEIVAGGLQKGFLYAMIALGYTMIYGVVKLINFAHGDIFMVGAFVSFYTITKMNMHHWIGTLYVRSTGVAQAPGWTLGVGVVLVILSSMVTSAALAMVVERVAYKPLRTAPRIASLITAVGVSFFLEYFSALDFSFGPDYVTYERPFDMVRWDSTNLNLTLLSLLFALLLIGGMGQVAVWGLARRGQARRVTESALLRLSIRFFLLAGGFGSLYMSLMLLGVGVTNIQILVMALSVFLLIGLQYIVNQTKIGRAMRASAWDKPTARLMGINVDQVISFTFALGAALAGAASVLYAVAYPQLVWNMGIMPGLRAFVAAVLGGIGSIPGAFVGSLIMGQAEELSAAYISTPMRDAIAFTLLIIVLIIRPTGIFGEPEGEKA
ncbi:MAG: branched-chain amino acid ABC transporter permease [Anaerolineae bacterium]|nr:branched-chain amino acid ABC transporter permease [Anaerolineae bacterium]